MAGDGRPNIEKKVSHGKRARTAISIFDIKHLLVDIQIQIASVLIENIALRTEIEEMKDSAHFNEKEFKDLKDSLQKTKNENKTLKYLLGDTRKEFKTAKNNITNQREEADQL